MRSIVLDTETTGLRAGYDRIIEIGAVEIIDRKIGRSFHAYCNPAPIRVESEALEVHGLTDEFLADHPTFLQIEQAFLEFLGGADELVIHNASFDVRMLNAQLSPPRDLTQWKVVDTMRLARSVIPGARSYRLDAMAKRLGVEGRDGAAHGALLDATILAHVYLRMTAGQDTIDLPQAPPAPGPLALAPRVQRHVFLANAEELKLHADFCALHGITVF